VIVGAYVYDNGQTDEGRAFVYHGSAAGLKGSTWVKAGDQEQPLWLFGRDGRGRQRGRLCGHDRGAYVYDNGQTDEGRAFVYHGSASGPAASPAWTAESNQVDGALRHVGRDCGRRQRRRLHGCDRRASGFDNGQTDEGRAFVYHGSASGLAANRLDGGERPGGRVLGGAVGTAGDVNGTGTRT